MQIISAQFKTPSFYIRPWNARDDVANFLAISLIMLSLKVLKSQLANVHNVFQVSMLRKYVLDPQHVIDFQPLELKEDLSYEELPSSILDRKEKVLRNHVIPYVKVLWQKHNL